MKNNVNLILDAWFDKYGKNSSAYPDERIAEIATNCVSLSSVWLERIKNASIEIALHNKEGVLCDTTYGVSSDNLAYTMLDILVNSNQKYSKMVINTFSYENKEKVSHMVGELNIS